MGYWGSGRSGGAAAPIFAATLLGIAFAPSYGGFSAGPLPGTWQTAAGEIHGVFWTGHPRHQQLGIHRLRQASDASSDQPWRAAGQPVAASGEFRRLKTTNLVITDRKPDTLVAPLIMGLLLERRTRERRRCGGNRQGSRCCGRVPLLKRDILREPLQKFLYQFAHGPPKEPFTPFP
jgi:hypothetical protein